MLTPDPPQAFGSSILGSQEGPWGSPHSRGKGSSSQAGTVAEDTVQAARVVFWG